MEDFDDLGGDPLEFMDRISPKMACLIAFLVGLAVTIWSVLQPSNRLFTLIPASLAFVAGIEGAYLMGWLKTFRTDLVRKVVCLISSGAFVWFLGKAFFEQISIGKANSTTLVYLFVSIVMTYMNSEISPLKRE